MEHNLKYRRILLKLRGEALAGEGGFGIDPQQAEDIPYRVREVRELGVDVFLGEGRFAGPDSVEVAGRTLRFRRAVIATGARPVDPPVAGLAEAGYLTNETVFSLTALPRRLLVLGGGPIGCELAQAFSRFGSAVTQLQRGRAPAAPGRPPWPTRRSDSRSR